MYSFVLSRGLHAFGVEKEDRIVNIKKKKPMTLAVDQLTNVVRAAEVFNLICKMLSFNPEQRPTATAILNDAFFYHPSYEISAGVETTVAVQPKPMGKLYNIFILFVVY
jgi:serine/threonine protein kinase